MPSRLIIQSHPDHLRATIVSPKEEVLTHGIFNIQKADIQTIRKTITHIKKEFGFAGDPVFILPEPGSMPLIEDIPIPFPHCITVKCQTVWELKTGGIRGDGTFILLEIGEHLNLNIIRRSKGREEFSHVHIGRMVVNFQEAVNRPHQDFFLQYYCGEGYFRKRAKKGSFDLYVLAQKGDPTAAQHFVEFGANVGSLLADLDILYQPKLVILTGSVIRSFGAWEHAMRREHKRLMGKRPAFHVREGSYDADQMAIGAYGFTLRHSIASMRANKKTDWPQMPER